MDSETPVNVDSFNEYTVPSWMDVIGTLDGQNTFQYPFTKSFFSFSFPSLHLFPPFPAPLAYSLLFSQHFFIPFTLMYLFTSGGQKLPFFIDFLQLHPCLHFFPSVNPHSSLPSLHASLTPPHCPLFHSFAPLLSNLHFKILQFPAKIQIPLWSR